jgi:low-density lipoprotein receptor-related protein 1 (alpha-2-macroglobulin receptor)
MEYVFRYLFYTDLGYKKPPAPALIGRAAMDGTQRTVLVNKKLSSPMGITLDYIIKMVFWTDAHMDQVECMDYNGANR